MSIAIWYPGLPCGRKMLCIMLAKIWPLWLGLTNRIREEVLRAMCSRRLRVIVLQVFLLPWEWHIPNKDYFFGLDRSNRKFLRTHYICPFSFSYNFVYYFCAVQTHLFIYCHSLNGHCCCFCMISFLLIMEAECMVVKIQAVGSNVPAGSSCHKPVS